MGQTASARTTRSSDPTKVQKKPSATAHPDPYKWTAIGMVAMFALTLPVILVAITRVQPDPLVPAWSVEAAALGVRPYEISLGQRVYHDTCAVCHGATGEGVPRLGKPLRNSAFVQEHSDEELFGLIVDGRKTSDPENTTGALMPPRGAQGLSDSSIDAVVLYLRAIQAEDEPVVSVAAWDLKGDGEGGAGLAGGAIELTGHAGYDLYISSCAACHGEGAEGLEELGLPLATSGFVRSKSDKDLITFIKMGRPIWDENNTTGLDMPPKGGNPAVTDEQLQTIVDYIRAVQEEAMGS